MAFEGLTVEQIDACYDAMADTLSSIIRGKYPDAGDIARRLTDIKALAEIRDKLTRNPANLAIGGIREAL